MRHLSLDRTGAVERCVCLEARVRPQEAGSFWVCQDWGSWCGGGFAASWSLLAFADFLRPQFPQQHSEIGGIKSLK